ncbi:MAG: glycosyltransferase [Oscillibacter sp.]|nr:glycosyltransferase [Oscillibacter sp.]
MSVKVSVVIPVYQAERYLRQCLDSVLGQDLREIEVICVDDCSTDGSVGILTEYSWKDSRVRVLRNPENLYAGCCRNRGLEAARGEYLLFMDADDWLFPDSLGRVYEAASRRRVDVLRCRAMDVDDRTGKTSLSVHNGLKRVPFFLFDRVVRYPAFYWLFPKVCAAPWGGIVRRQFLLERDIQFNDLLCVNDRSFFWETVLKAERIVFSRELLIHYRTNISSSLVGGRIRNFFCHLESYRLVSALCGDLPDRERRRILDAELLDIAHWAERSADTEYAGEVQMMLRQFLDSMDRRPWNGRIEGTRWYRRLFC